MFILCTSTAVCACVAPASSVTRLKCRTKAVAPSSRRPLEPSSRKQRREHVTTQRPMCPAAAYPSRFQRRSSVCKSVCVCVCVCVGGWVGGHTPTHEKVCVCVCVCVCACVCVCMHAHIHTAAAYPRRFQRTSSVCMYLEVRMYTHSLTHSLTLTLSLTHTHAHADIPPRITMENKLLCLYDKRVFLCVPNVFLSVCVCTSTVFPCVPNVFLSVCVSTTTQCASLQSHAASTKKHKKSKNECKKTQGCSPAATHRRTFTDTRSLLTLY